MTDVAAPDRPTPSAKTLLRVDRVAARLAVAALVIGLAYLVIVPLVRLQALAFEDGAQPYVEAFSRPGIADTIGRTVILALASVAIALVIGTGLAWGATFLSPRLRWLRILPLLPIVVPTIASVLGWIFLLSPGPGYINQLLRHLPWWHDAFQGPIDVYTLPWIVIITGVLLSAFVYLFVSAGLDNIDGALIQAAHVCGSSTVGVFFRVVLPLLRPSLTYGGGVALMLGLGQFTPPLLLGTNAGVTVLTTDMYFLTQQVPARFAEAAAIGSPLLVFGLAVLIVQRLMLGNHTRFVTHAGKGGFRRHGRSSLLGAGSLVLYGALTTLLPLFALATVGLSRFWSGSIDPTAFTLDNFREIIDAPNVAAAVRTSVVASLAAVLISLPLGFVLSTLLRKRREHRLAGPILDFIVATPLSIPAVIFGVGFLLTYTHAPLVLYGTRWVLILVYVTLMVPFSTRMQLSALITLGDTYEKASRASGAGLLRTNFMILIPLMRSTFAGAAALMFILLANEFAASLLVRSATTQVMGTILYDYYGNASYPPVACIALIMVAVTAAGVALALAAGGADAFRKL